MRIGLVEFLLILAIASLTVGPQVALFVDRWMRRANCANARAARRRAEYAAQMAAERDALLKRFRTASTVFGVGILLALVYALVFRPIDTPPQRYAAPEVRRSTGAVQTALSADSRLGHLGVAVHRGVLPHGVVSEEHVVQRFRQPGAAVDGDKGVFPQQALVVDALGQKVLAASGLAGQQDGG